MLMQIKYIYLINTSKVYPALLVGLVKNVIAASIAINMSYIFVAKRIGFCISPT